MISARSDAASLFFSFAHDPTDARQVRGFERDCYVHDGALLEEPRARATHPVAPRAYEMAERDGRVWCDAPLAGLSTAPRPSSTPEVRGPPAPDSACSNPDPSPGSASGLAAHVQSLGWESREFSDVRVTAFGKEYPLHRLVLSRSPYFRALMRGPWADASAPSLTLAFDDPFVTAPAVECCLAFLYDKPPAFEKRTDPPLEGRDDRDDPLFALRVLAASNFLDLDHLSRLCADYVAESVSLGDCLALQTALDGRAYGEHGERARAAVWGFICAHASVELSHDLHRLHPATLDALMRDDHLWVADETERFALARRVAAAARRALDDAEPEPEPQPQPESEPQPQPQPDGALRVENEEKKTESTRRRDAHTAEAVATLVLVDAVSAAMGAPAAARKHVQTPTRDGVDADARRRALDSHALATAATLRDGVRYQHVPFDDLRVMKRALEAEEKDVRAAAYRRAARGADDEGEDTAFPLEATRALLDSTPARAVAEGWWKRTALAARVTRRGAHDWVPGVDAPFRFGVRFEDVRELRDGQGAKHSREVFYAGSLWKVSAQAFSDEDPKGRRTLGLFLHRRRASEESDGTNAGSGGANAESSGVRADAALRSAGSEIRARGDALDALTHLRSRGESTPFSGGSNGERAENARARGPDALPDAVSSSRAHQCHGGGGMSHFVDRREVVDVRYELVCPSRHETVRLGSLDASAKPTTLPRAPKGWGWRTALLHEDLERMCDAQGALRVVAAIVVDAAAEDAREYDARVDADAAEEAAAAARAGDAHDNTEGFDGDVEEDGREHLVLRY